MPQSKTTNYPKIELRLSQSLKSSTSKEIFLMPLFGAYQSERRSEQLITEIVKSRLFKRERETITTRIVYKKGLDCGKLKFQILFLN